MAYFPHAYQKMLVAKDGNSASGFIAAASTASAALTAGQLAVIDAKTNASIALSTSTTAVSNPLVYIAQGSYYAADKLGPFHGGYQESVKTKGINPKFVSAFYVTAPAAPVANVQAVNVVNCDTIKCNSTYRLRVDVKGSPALRFLTHNAYLTVDAITPCCDGESNTVDPAIVLLSWKDQIANSPIMSQFISPKVYNYKLTGYASSTTTASTFITLDNTSGAGGTFPTGVAVGQLITGAGIPENTYITNINAGVITLSNPATIATTTDALKIYEEINSATYVPETGETAPDSNDLKLVLTGAYVDTTFNNCSFSPMDHVELQPIQIYASPVTGEGEPCAISCFTFVEWVQAYQGKGFGETLVRELILSKRYAQEPWNNDPRMREVLKDTTFDTLNRSDRYFVYHILHSVPRKSNPSGTMDNDQYLIKIVTPARNADFEVGFLKLLNTAGNYDCGTAGTASIGSTGITVQA